MFVVCESVTNRFKGYSGYISIIKICLNNRFCTLTPIQTLLLVMGKVEGNKENWHGHVTCLSVAPEFRRQGVSKILMNDFEKTSEL